MKSFALTMIFLMIFSLSSTYAATVQLPEWYQMELDLSQPPRLNEKLQAKVTLRSIAGDLENVTIRLIIPEGWKVDVAQKQIKLIKSGDKTTVSFEIVPVSYLSQGSIIAEASLKVPFSALEELIAREHPEQSKAMIATLRSWPPVSKRYSEASFALVAEESFYPLGQGMWLNYADNLTTAEGFRGPVFFDDGLITTHQAQTDVEMFEKLQTYSKADPELEKKLNESGIDIERKKLDQLNGLYVLATRMFISKEFQQALDFINRLETESKTLANENIENLEIAALNLKGLIFWGMNQKRLAEDFLKKAFYRNRKNPLQRYVLRNIGLLMLANGEKSVAEQMMRLATAFKEGYTLLEQEYEKVKTP
jgi:tetratricopeptide (TPR) repeat protein